ncbi:MULTISPECIES: YCF48-related protein [unclassified Undibacterium]|uniref:WD40/YVTN/BNR-like repeat-containing protein n=1 Tax=unclassified Undibacterium TaxID=2630295 RepID=UPI003391C1AD
MIITISAQATPIGDALDRPALTSRQAAKVVLLSGAQVGGRLVAVGERGVIVLSEDDGATWRQVPAPVSVTLTSVRFNGSHGIAVGHGGIILTSDDAGSTWTRQFDGRLAAQMVLETAQKSGDLITEKIALRLVADGPDKPFLDVLVIGARRAIAVGAYGLIFATEDGGKTWISRMSAADNPQGLHLYAARARGQQIVIAGEQGLLLRSIDGGQHFERITTPYKGSFFTLELPNDNEIVVAGLRGNIWRSIDAGSQWSQVPVSMPASITGSALRADGSLVMVNQASVILQGHDGVLIPLKTPLLPPLNAVLVRRDGSLLALTMQGAIGLDLASAVAGVKP